MKNTNDAFVIQIGKTEKSMAKTSTSIKCIISTTLNSALGVLFKGSYHVFTFTYVPIQC